MREITRFLLPLLFLLALACSKERADEHPFGKQITLSGTAADHLVNVVIRLPRSSVTDRASTHLEIEATTVSGSGVLFEATGIEVTWKGEQLLFTWKDMFGNHGEGSLSPLADAPGSYRLNLTAVELMEPRVARYLHEYPVQEARALGNAGSPRQPGVPHDNSI